MFWDDLLVFLIIFAGIIVYDSPNIFCIWRLKRSAKLKYYRSIKILEEQIDKSVKTESDLQKNYIEFVREDINVAKKTKSVVDQLFGHYEKDKINSYWTSKYWLAYNETLYEYANDMESSLYIGPNWDKQSDWKILMESYRKIFNARLEGITQNM